MKAVSKGAFRSQLSAAVAQGDLATVLQMMTQGPHAREWMTGAVIAQAAGLQNLDVIRALLKRSEPDVQVAGAVALVNKNDRGGMLALARVGGEAVRGTLIQSVAKSDDVELMTQLVHIYREKPGMSNELKDSLLTASVGEQWKMFRYLLGEVHGVSLIDNMSTVLRAMVSSTCVPLDLVEQALGWVSPGDVRRADVGSLLVYAAQSRCIVSMPLLLKESHMPEWAKHSAIVEAGMRGYDQMVDFLIPFVVMNELGDELERQLKNTHGASFTIKHSNLVRCANDIGRHLAPDELNGWATRFEGHALPIVQARLREIHTLAGEGDLTPPVSAGRSRARP